MKGIIFCLFSFLTVGSASAGELITPPLSPSSLNDDNFTQCVATNVSGASQTVTIEGFDSEGNTAAFLTVDIDPNHTRGFSLAELPGPTGPVLFCRFSFKGTEKALRASIHVLDSGGEGVISALAAY